jgi:cysteine synthase A
MMAALGAEVVLVDQLPDSTPGKVTGGDVALVEVEAQRIAKERQAFRADQFQLDGNFRAHYLYTGPEILRQVGGTIDAFCDYVGTAGSFSGCAAAFKEANPATKCYLIEPEHAAVLAGEAITNPCHRIQGGGYSIPGLKFINPDHVDGYLKVSDEEAIHTARRLAREEAIFAGFSSGANVAVALRLLQTAHPGATIVTLMCDSGLKYLSTDLWEEFDA